ncbi:MAG: glycosyltransferase family 4 protein [Candidatus Latescibacterota bacterium]
MQFDVVTSSIEYNHCENYYFEGVKVKRIAQKQVRPYHRVKTHHFFSRCIQAFKYHRDWQRNFWPESLRMLHFLKRHGDQFDLLHTFGHAATTSASLMYAKMTGKPILIELVNLMKDPHQYEPAIISRLYGKGFPKQAHIVCLSNKLKELCIDHGYSEDQLWTRPNPVDETRFYYEPNARVELPFQFPELKNSDIRILQIAKFRPLKNQLFMVNVLKLLPDNFKLILAGPLAESGPISTSDKAYFKTLQDAIKTFHLEKRVFIIPEFIQNPEKLMKSSDIFVMPSTSEALGTPSLEALSCGVPVVTSDIPGVFDQWIKPGINGFICPLIEQEWADKIQQTAKISRVAMQLESKAILDWAATSAIDTRYFEKLQTLIANK